jgi:hypothetical protein
VTSGHTSPAIASSGPDFAAYERISPLAKRPMFWRNCAGVGCAAVARAGQDRAAVERLARRLEARENDRTPGLCNWRQRQLVFRQNPG